MPSEVRQEFFLKDKQEIGVLKFIIEPLPFTMGPSNLGVREGVQASSPYPRSVIAPLLPYTRCQSTLVRIDPHQPHPNRQVYFCTEAFDHLLQYLIFSLSNVEIATVFETRTFYFHRPTWLQLNYNRIFTVYSQWKQSSSISKQITPLFFHPCLSLFLARFPSDVKILNPGSILEELYVHLISAA